MIKLFFIFLLSYLAAFAIVDLISNRFVAAFALGIIIFILYVRGMPGDN